MLSVELLTEEKCRSYQRRYVVWSESIPCQHRCHLLTASATHIMCMIVHLYGAIDALKIYTTL